MTNNAIFKNIGEPRHQHIEWSQTNMISLIYGILKNCINELLYKTNRLIDIDNKHMVTKGNSEGGG